MGLGHYCRSPSRLHKARQNRWVDFHISSLILFFSNDVQGPGCVRVIFDCLCLIPCFGSVFPIWVWLVELRFIPWVCVLPVPVKTVLKRVVHSLLLFLVAISTTFFSMSSDILIGLCMCVFDAIPSMLVY